MTAAVAHDLLSEQLIAELLENDLRSLESMKPAEKLQADKLVTATSAQGRIKRSNPDSAATTPDSDADLAFQMYLFDSRVANDAAYAQSIQNETSTMDTVDRQYAQRLATNERKIGLDAEFARRLQAIDDEGEDIDLVEDAESTLGDMEATFDPSAAVEDLKGPPAFAMNPPIKTEDAEINSTLSGTDNHAKGKGRQLSSPQHEWDHEGIRDTDESSTISKEDDTSSSLDLDEIPYPTCGICMESFIMTYSPISATLSANSSNKLPYGLRLPCPQDHAYCISCMTSYIQNKLDPDGTGAGKSSAVVFPIRCPECPLGEWPGGIEDEIAQRVLEKGGMVDWHHQRLLDTIPRLFCPNPKCSSLVEADEDDEDPEAACPSCQEIMCVPCRTRWHTGLTCEEYQALPLDERSPEDRLVLDLAKAEQWRRCPNCSVIVELVSGCNHMICRCGFHFCFKCGSPTTEDGICKNNPRCEVWDEDMLLEQRERERNRPANNAQPVHIPQYQPRVRRAHRDVLNWMDDPGASPLAKYRAVEV
ncbi:hypothetical protein D9615_004990 [Tricholomella constricta]|uniref:RBR-type E3 ubiquitin transferase n=1 Tax=Tricholomella constricta TaxID=117010 RepID=A0A8H5M6L9_9AGAR|nr:hypothetical protein D9615_004990 [Tricholomella constricta]